ncbi:MAG: hypothetical protein MZV49_04320 [Rhodopseudomonas palustris]|nr:hypothetical protein [Rhodopseudomonas palustris]
MPTSWFAEFWGYADVLVETATLRDAARLAELHAVSFARGWSEQEFEDMLSERNTMVHRLRLGRRIIGFIVSRIGADEAEILSIAIDPARPWPPAVAAICCARICSISRVAASGRCFSRSRKTISRRAGCTIIPVLTWSDGASAIIASRTDSN